MSIRHSNPDFHARRALGAKLAGAAAIAVLLIAGCGSSKSESTPSTNAAAPETNTAADASQTDGTAESPNTSNSGDNGETASPSGSDLPDPCTLLTTADINTVLVGADDGTRQLSACVWTDPEGTAARLVLNRPAQGTPLDTAQGSPLDGVGDEAVLATAPGTVRIIARSNGIEIAFSVDTGTSDIKPNQANAITLVNTVIDELS